jgi:hypothetical protein
MKEKDYTIAQKKKSMKLEQYPFKKGEIVGDFIINRDDYVYHHKRYQIELTCNCGKTSYKRLSQLLKDKNQYCSKCRGYNNYPKDRLLRSDIFENEIHKIWISITNQNLNRGSRILESTINTKDLQEQYLKQKGICCYTGISLNILNTLKKDSNASIDRRDSNLGYTPDNIQWVYKPLNIMKNSFSEKEFLFVCNQVTNFTRQL